MKHSLMKKKIVSLLLTVFALFLFTGAAFAHVKVFPEQTVQGADDQVFTVRVPTEKAIPTVKLKLKVPQSVDIDGVEPVTGWTASFAKDDSGKITAITWTATNGGLAPAHFGEFHIIGTVGDQATSLDWKAYQTYQDGSVINWVGAEGSDHPGPVTKVVAADATSAANGNASNGTPYLSIAALVVSVIALIVSLMKRKTTSS